MACIDIEKDTHIADLTFVPKQNGIYIYSDMVKIQMALDDNSILNFDQTSYATRHYARTIPAPAVSKEQILRNMNPHFQIDEVRLALIPDEYSSEELLTYEVRGSIVNEAFSIFVNASTGQEVRIVRRTSPETA
jgi:spore germination protein